MSARTNLRKLGWPGIWSLGALVLPGGAIELVGGDGFESVLLMASGRSPAMVGER
jgi:hypothetical protein